MSAADESPIRLTLDSQADREILAELDTGEPGKLFAVALSELVPNVEGDELTRESRDNGETWAVSLIARRA